MLIFSKQSVSLNECAVYDVQFAKTGSLLSPADKCAGWDAQIGDSNMVIETAYVNNLARGDNNWKNKQIFDKQRIIEPEALKLI